MTYVISADICGEAAAGIQNLQEIHSPGYDLFGRYITKWSGWEIAPVQPMT